MMHVDVQFALENGTFGPFRSPTVCPKRTRSPVAIWRAVQEATERGVTLRTSETVWIRVTDEKRGHVFEYSFSL